MWDLCGECATHSRAKTSMKKMVCFSGHPMVKTFDIARFNKKEGGSYESNVYTCDKCKTENLDCTEIGVYHCNICEFDMCPPCSSASKKKVLKKFKDDAGHLMDKTFDIAGITKNIIAYKDN